MPVSYQQYVALNERLHVSPLLVLSFAQLGFFGWLHKHGASQKNHCFSDFQKRVA